MSDNAIYQSLITRLNAKGRFSLSVKERKELAALLEASETAQTDCTELSHKLRLKEAQLQAAQTDVKNLRRSLDALYGSTSWKVAAPLRLVKNKLTRSKSAAKSPRLRKINSRKSAQQGLPSAWAAAPARRPAQSAKPLYVERDNTPAPDNLPAALYAFYLPQFHPITENSKWWGEGFTEWTNVRPAEPLYEGHYQPHVPDPKGGLGYYDLRDTSEVMGKQIELARHYGVEGFCFYFYWFAGKRLLETPLLNLLDDPQLDVPFCLCWANENWSRRWDGRDDDVLMAQNNTPEDDLAFIEYVSKYLKDPRYRRIDGKPLLIVYRPIELPDAKATAKRWRTWCRKNGVGDIYLAYTQSFENNDPRDYGFDAAIEFPPNNSAPPDITEQVTPLSGAFAGKVYDWDIFPTRSDNYAAPDYPLFRTVCPAWDNTARRKQGGTVFKNSTAERYRYWLANALLDSEARIEETKDRLIFVNAWNEWAEGAHLEPDARHGHAYLEATRTALIEHKARGAKRIVLVTHDALPHGAQYLTLNLAREFNETFGYKVDIVTLGEGGLIEAFAEAATLHDLSAHAPDSPAVRSLAAELSADGASLAICNTTVSGPFAKTLKSHGFNVISLIHELTGVIEQYGLQSAAKDIAAEADKIVFPAALVKNSFEAITSPLGDKAVLCPQGAYKVNRLRRLSDIQASRQELRAQLKLSPTSHILLGVGYADARKGFDLFLDIAERLPKDKSDIVCVWIGHQEPYVEPQLVARMTTLQASGRLILPGRVTDTDLFYGGSDVFLLTSREDPYPSTVLESLDVGLPVIGFEGVTGSTELITEYGGQLVPAFDTDAMTAAALRALVTTGDKTRTDILTRFRARPDISFRGYAHDLLSLAGQGLNENVAQVSVIVPNYNYAHFLKDRIETAASQSYPIREIILLDDASTDNSLEIISEIIANTPIPTRFIPNAKNSGSVFAQWLKGVEAARSEFVWIAEADDLSLPRFLETAMAGFSDPDVVMSYTQSSQMSHDGHILDETYLSYVSDINPLQWTRGYIRSGKTEISDGLSVKNSVPNVSGVVFRREPLLRALTAHLDHIKSYRVAGDWAAYVHILSGTQGAKIAFNPAPLNLHRRHSQSLTLSKFSHAQLDEIRRMQNYAAQTVDVSPEMAAKAERYLETLREQFNLGAQADIPSQAAQ